eukprot:1753941-Rhodomonas_salina.1
MHLAVCPYPMLLCTSLYAPTLRSFAPTLLEGDMYAPSVFCYALFCTDIAYNHSKHLAVCPYPMVHPT